MFMVVLLRAFWKGLLGKSLIFSIVFAMAVMGASFAGLLRTPLRSFGLGAPLVFFLPILATGLLAKYERKIPLRRGFRRLCCYLLIFGSVASAVGLKQLRLYWAERVAKTDVTIGVKQAPVRPVGQPPRPLNRR